RVGEAQDFSHSEIMTGFDPRGNGENHVKTAAPLSFLGKTHPLTWEKSLYWQLGCTRAMLCSISMNSPVRSDSSARNSGSRSMAFNHSASWSCRAPQACAFAGTSPFAQIPSSDVL